MFGPSPEFLKYAAAIVMQRKEDAAYLERAISDGRAIRGSEKHPNAIFINGEGPMIDLVAIRKLRADAS
jgi:hypothetical protein